MKRWTDISPDRTHMYRDLFEESKDTVYVSSREGKILNINRAAVELFGYSMKELIGMDIRALYGGCREAVRGVPPRPLCSNY